MNPVVHFEMPYDDSGRIGKFYQAAFGWKIKNLGEKMGDYVLVTTTESKSDGTPKDSGKINGGFFPKKADWPAQYPNVVIAIDDINDAMDKIRGAGGEVLGEPMEIPGYGMYVSFTDTEGNRVALMEPTPMMQDNANGPAKKAASKKPAKMAAKKKAKRL